MPGTRVWALLNNHEMRWCHWASFFHTFFHALAFVGHVQALAVPFFDTAINVSAIEPQAFNLCAFPPRLLIYFGHRAS